METLIKLETSHENIATENKILVDNSTDFKDFTIERTKLTSDRKNSIVETLHIQLNKEDISLKIGNITLFKREIELLKEFLNQ